MEAVPDEVEYEMIRSTIDDATAGLNGAARLYTGAMHSCLLPGAENTVA